MFGRKESLLGRLSRSMRRRPGRAKTAPTGLIAEALEDRRMLAVGTVPSIQGTVFVDANNNGSFDAGEGVAGATVQLFTDDGDGVFETNGEDVQFGSDLLTDANGDYCFDGIDAADNYFVRQTTQVASGFSLTEQVSGLQEPGTPNLVIDTFDTNQEAIATSPAPSSAGGNLTFADETEVIGAERDIFAELLSGVGEVELIVNPFNLLPVLQLNSSAGVQGRAVVTWDGIDADSSPTPSMGLGGADLTQSGLNTGIAMNLGVDDAGAGEELMMILYQGDPTNSSSATATIPTTDGSAQGFLFIPFSDFSGPVDPSNVDAVQLILGQGIPSADAQVDTIGVLGPKVVDFQNDPTVDLAINKENATDTVVTGDTITYTITVENLGPLDVFGATVTDIFPAEILNPSYTSTTTGTVSGNTDDGTGPINDTVDMTAGSTIVYSVTGTVASSATGTIDNTATVTAPSALSEMVLNNNESTESDTVINELDLTITKDDGVTDVQANDTLNYTIVVSNTGPSDVTGATIADTFPAELTNVSFTTTTSGVVSGQSASGTGDINDTVDMTAGSSITYDVTATVASTATGSITNTATVTAPNGVTETNTANNSAEDIDNILTVVDLAISKDDGVTTVIPGETLTYTIVAQNLGPNTAVDAVIQDTFPATLTGVSYTSTASGGASGQTSGSGDINDTVTMPPDSSITYTVTGTVSADATGQITNTATITAPTTATETVLNNNSADDTDTLTPTVDLSVSKNDNVSTVEIGDSLTYTITVMNNGPSDVSGATFADTFPAELTGISYTSSPSGGASGNTAGSGNLNETLDLPAGSSVTYTVMAVVAEGSVGEIVNTATVTAPNGVTESNNGNNTATDTDTIVPEFDISVTKTNNADQVFAGGQTTYTIVVTNDGPAAANGVLVTDNVPAQVTNLTYTSSSTGGATGNTNGSGDINDTLDMPAGSTVTYTAVADVDVEATGQLSNEVTITAPANTVDVITTNNTDADADPIELQLAQISGFVYVDANNDGNFGSNESPIEGVQIDLLDAGLPIASTLTTATGAYAFTDLVPGTYVVSESQPDGFRDGRETVGGSIGEVLGDDQFVAELDPGANATELNFGELPLQPSKRSLIASSFRN